MKEGERVRRWETELRFFSRPDHAFLEIFKTNSQTALINDDWELLFEDKVHGIVTKEAISQKKSHIAIAYSSNIPFSNLLHDD